MSAAKQGGPLRSEMPAHQGHRATLEFLLQSAQQPARDVVFGIGLISYNQASDDVTINAATQYPEKLTIHLIRSELGRNRYLIGTTFDNFEIIK